MNRHSLKILAAVTLVLVLTVLFVERTDDSSPVLQRQLLLQGLRDTADEADEVRILQPDSAELTLRRAANQWVVPARDSYAADIGTLRPLVVALTDARILEEKTSNPELYEKLAVDDPEDGGSGTRIAIEGTDFSYVVILGDSAAGDSRYARIPGEATSYLVDQNPSVPDEISDWLSADVIDIDAQRVRKATILHDDGETITVEKDAEDVADFTVLDIPPGRELSYATVGDSIAGALSDVKLEDVRKAREEDAPFQTSAVFDTWDGLRVTIEIRNENEDAWLSLSAQHIPAATSTDASIDEGQGEEPESLTSEDDAREINDRLSGWQYRLPDYKTNQLTRRWEDLLKSADAEASTG